MAEIALLAVTYLVIRVLKPATPPRLLGTPSVIRQLPLKGN